MRKLIATLSITTALLCTLGSCMDIARAYQRRQVAGYYQEKKQEIDAQYKAITGILDQYKDYPEFISTALTTQFDNWPEKELTGVQNALAGKPTKGSIYPLDETKVLACSIETYKDSTKFPSTGWRIDNPIATLSRTQNMNADNYYGLEDLETFKKDVTAFLQIKNLVVADCILYQYAALQDRGHFTPGYVLSKITVYNIPDKSIADSYYLQTNNSSSVTVMNKNLDDAYLTEDLFNNVKKEITASVLAGK